VVASGWPVDADNIDALHAEVSAWRGVLAAADRLDEKLALVRLLADSGAAFHDAREHVRVRLGGLS
jgi:hypothetical protein